MVAVDLTWNLYKLRFYNLTIPLLLEVTQLCGENPSPAVSEPDTGANHQGKMKTEMQMKMKRNEIFSLVAKNL